MKNKNTLLREADEYVNSIYELARNQNGMYTQVQVKQAYIAGKKSLQKENTELKKQIEKMKCCGNCRYCDADNPCRFHRENRQCENYYHWELAE